jgi:ABC-type phosphate/phosphonate transport system substrate-binding protein
MALASLPMYDLPEVEKATDSLWAGLARGFRREGLDDVPARLSRGDPRSVHWAAADLLFSQSCGYPLMHDFADRLQIVATPCYDAPGCAGPSYSSLVIVREDAPAREVGALRGAIAAVNSVDSQSGYSALRALVAPLHRRGCFFGAVRESGSHAASIEMVAAGEADVASIDCVTHALLERHRPEALAGTRVLCRTASAPGLPYVTAASTSGDTVRRLQAGLFRALGEADLATARDALLLADAEVLPLSAYNRIRQMEAAAVEAGYPRLR